MMCYLLNHLPHFHFLFFETNQAPYIFSLDLYILSYNSNKQLTTGSLTLKENLVTYLNQYRMVTDAINIKDAYYINIGFNFDITVVSGYSNKDVITNCINVFAGKNHFVCEERLDYNIPRDQLLKGLHPNYNPDRFILGFPSLQSKTKVVLIFKLFRIWSQIVMVHQIGKLAEKEQANKNSG